MASPGADPGFQKGGRILGKCLSYPTGSIVVIWVNIIFFKLN